MISKSKIVMLIMAAALAFTTPLVYADTGNEGNVYQWHHSPGFGDRHGKHHYRHHHRHHHRHHRHHHGPHRHQQY